jgi:small conductance mechanosensitive channel
MSAATTTTTVAAQAASGGPVGNDRGIIRQLLVDAGVSHSSAHTAEVYLAAPARIAVILVIAFILARLVSRLSRRLVNALRLVSPLLDTTPRGEARVRTLAGAFTSIFRTVIWIVALLEILAEFDISLTPFVATATVIGAAVGFGAQTLVKDFLSGVLILAEDQYGVGDHIAIGVGANQTVGTVESVNLRVTRLRGADGGILYVPNGDIRTLSNDTETDSQALVDIHVPAGTDLVAAGRAAEEAAREMADDPDWAGDFVGRPYFAGVPDAAGTSGATIRVMVLTRPGRHLRAAAEMRLRIVERLRRDGLAWGPPAPQVVRLQTGVEPVADERPADDVGIEVHQAMPTTPGPDAESRGEPAAAGDSDARDSDAGAAGVAAPVVSAAARARRMLRRRFGRPSGPPAPGGPDNPD